MRFKIDENLPAEVASVRALVTLDLDFSNVQAYPPADYAGLVVLRVQRQDKIHVLDVFGKVVPLLDAEELTHRLWIVDETRVRIRA